MSSEKKSDKYKVDTLATSLPEKNKHINRKTKNFYALSTNKAYTI